MCYHLFDTPLWEKYKSIVEENKRKRKQRGDFKENEPEECIQDEMCRNDTETSGKPINFPRTYTTLLSARWVMDLFGDDWNTVSSLLQVRDCTPMSINGNLYFREQEITNVIVILSILAKSNFVNTLRPVPSAMFIDSPPVYTSQDLMSILDIGDATLRKLRDNGFLTFRKMPNGDKIWYTQDDLNEFLENSEVKKEAWIK